MSHFDFATATRIIFGPGALRQAGALAKDFGRRALVVTGREASRAAPLLDDLRRNGVEAAAFPTHGEPELETVQQGLDESVEAARRMDRYVTDLLGGRPRSDGLSRIGADRSLG